MSTTKTLSGALRHPEAATLAAELSAALEAGDLRLDTAEATQVSCGVVQVIVSAQMTAKVLDRNLQVQVAPDSAFAAALERLGVTV